MNYSQPKLTKYGDLRQLTFSPEVGQMVTKDDNSYEVTAVTEDKVQISWGGQDNRQNTLAISRDKFERDFDA